MIPEFKIIEINVPAKNASVDFYDEVTLGRVAESLYVYRTGGYSQYRTESTLELWMDGKNILPSNFPIAPLSICFTNRLRDILDISKKALRIVPNTKGIIQGRYIDKGERNENFPYTVRLIFKLKKA